MSELLFENSEATAEQRFQQIMPVLHNGEVLVEFTKKDGSKRVMPCTLKAELLPPPKPHETNTDTPIDFPETKKVNYETITVWCTDKNEWRAFKTMNVISIKAK